MIELAEFRVGKLRKGCQLLVCNGSLGANVVQHILAPGQGLVDSFLPILEGIEFILGFELIATVYVVKVVRN